MIELTKGQKEGLEKVKKWFKSSDSKQMIEIAGYSGTGKSTFVNYAIESLEIPKNHVLFGTYTGKAALVLTMKGCKATTIHSMIYEPRTEPVVLKDNEGFPILDENGNKCYSDEVQFIKKEKLGDSIELIVIDECSMIDEQTLEDLLSFNIPIIVLGDINQLKPINGEPILLRNPDIMFTEIMRQKEDNPIIYLSKLAREGKYIPTGTYGKSVVIDKSEITRDIKDLTHKSDNIFIKSGQNLCRTNKTRNMLNNHIRRNIYNLTRDIPNMNEKLICRRNNKSLFIKDEIEINMVNGLIGYVVNPVTRENMNYDNNFFKMDFRPEFCKEDYFDMIPVSDINFHNNYTEKQAKYLQYKQWKYFQKKNYNCNLFEFGYAITDYLSQGSEWNSVFIYDEIYGNMKDYYNSLYMMITRASKKVIIAKEYKRYY